MAVNLVLRRKSMERKELWCLITSVINQITPGKDVLGGQQSPGRGILRTSSVIVAWKMQDEKESNLSDV